MTIRPLVLSMLVLACAAPSLRAQGAAPAKDCDVVTTGVVVNGQYTTSTTLRGPRGFDTTWVGGGVDARCEGTDQRVRSDSAEHYTEKKLLILIGRVHYTESRLTLDCDRLTYDIGQERLIAEGHVVGVTNTGTRFLGPHADYLRPAVGIRTQAHLVAEPRSTIWISPQDAGKGSKDSVNVQADRIVMDNDSLIFARGTVIIERPDLLATGDSAFVNKATEFARLMQTPKVAGRGERHFTLVGDRIDIFSKQHEVERVKSLAHAVATSDDITLKADTIDLRVSNQKLERAYAWGRTPARAHSNDQDIIADSIDVFMPGQTLRTLRAIGLATAESHADTTKIRSKQLDFLTGDTIIAHFDTVTAADTVKQPAIREIFAKGTKLVRARSYYQVARSGETITERPNVNYVIGDSITVTFRKRQVYEVRVLGHAEGFYDELIADTTRAAHAKDSTAVKPAGKPAGTKRP